MIHDRGQQSLKLPDHMPQSTSHNLALKGTISDPKFQTSLFSEPQIFLHIQEEIQYNKLHVEQFPRKQRIFGKTDNF